MTQRKIALSIEEAADYTGIGRNTLRPVSYTHLLTAFALSFTLFFVSKTAPTFEPARCPMLEVVLPRFVFFLSVRLLATALPATAPATPPEIPPALTAQMCIRDR